MMASLPPGSTLGAYRIERLLGRGGMSAVYLAEHAGLKRKVALKVLSPSIADDPQFRERFVRESELAASLEDPNVLPVYEAGEHDGVMYIAMRYVDGRDLKTLIDQEGPLDPARVVWIVEQVANALGAAHAKGLVHRDVKPGNILVAPASGSRPEHAYLSDFGLTKRTTSGSGLTGTGVFAGTLSYAAPEQFEGRPLDGRTDVYSLGCVLFECLTGAPPFRKEQDAALMYAHLHELPPSATSLRPELPGAVDRVIEKAMAKQPNARYPTASDLAKAFRAAVGGEPPSEAAPRPNARRRLALAGALVALGSLIALIALTRGGGNPEAIPRSSPSAAAEVTPPRSILRIDPETGEPSLVARDVPGLERTLPVEPNLAVGEGGVWLYSFSPAGFAAFLLHLDEETGEVRERVPVAFTPGAGAGLAVGSRTVWFSGSDLVTRVSRINPSTHDALEPVSVRAGAVTDIVLGGGVLWVGSNDGTLTEFDPLTGRRLDEVQIDATPDSLAFGANSVWALDSLGNEVIRVDASSGRISGRIPLNGTLESIAAGDGGIWVLDGVAGTAIQIDPETNTARPPIGVGPDPSAIEVGLGSAWVTDAEEGKLYRLDPDLQSVTVIDVGAPIAAIAIDEAGRSVWVCVFASEG